MNPTPGESKLSDPLLYRDYSRKLIRDWVSITTPHEFVLLCFIFDRTIGWCKEWETISWDQFMNGVYSEDGRCYNRGTKMARATLARMLKALQTDGFILTRPGPLGTNKYALAFDRKHSEQDMFRTSKKHSGDSGEESGPKFRVSRKGGAARGAYGDDKTSIPPIHRREEYPSKSHTETPERYHTETAKSHAETIGSHSETQRDSEKKEVTPKEETGVNLNHSDSGVLLSQILKETTLRRTSHLDQILADPDPSKAELGHLWHMVWKQSFEAAPYVQPKDKDLTALCAYKKRFRKEQASNVTFSQFIQWCVQYWTMVMSESFSWMANYPALPSVLFLIKHSEIFERTFSNRDYLLRIASLPRRERMIHELVHRQGKPVDVAIAEVDEQLKPKVVPPPILYSPPIVQQVAPKYVAPARPKCLDDDTPIDWDKYSRL